MTGYRPAARGIINTWLSLPADAWGGWLLRSWASSWVYTPWWLVAGGWWLVAGGWWLVAGGWWLVAGGWWLVAGGWWLVAGRSLVARLS